MSRYYSKVVALRWQRIRENPQSRHEPRALPPERCERLKKQWRLIAQLADLGYATSEMAHEICGPSYQEEGKGE